MYDIKDKRIIEKNSLCGSMITLPLMGYEFLKQSTSYVYV